MNIQDVQTIYKEGSLVLYQDEVYAIIDVDVDHNQVLIEKGEYEGPGQLTCRRVSPDQLEAIDE